MISIEVTTNGDVEEVKLAGRIDVKAAKEADEVFAQAAATGRNVVLDFSEVEYIASAGLRSLKRLRGNVRDQGTSLTVRNVADNVMEIFEMTGFAAMLNFE